MGTPAGPGLFPTPCRHAVSAARSGERPAPFGADPIGTISPTEAPANLAWGDADGQALYMTARTGLYRIRTNTVGIRP